MLNKLKKKQHYKRIGEDPRRTQGVGGQNRVLSPPFIIPVVLTTENLPLTSFLVTFTCITTFTSENPFLHRNRGVNQHI